MPNLHDRAIKLAFDNPGEVRDKLLPILAKHAANKVAWDWKKDGIPPTDSRLIGQKWTGKVYRTFGQHHSGFPFSMIERKGWQQMRGQQDPYQKVVMDDSGVILNDFGSHPRIRW